MFKSRTAIFLVSLIQDLSVLRPLAIMAHRDFGFEVRFLVAAKFRSRDMFGIWEAELELLAKETAARVVIYRQDFEAQRELDGAGLIFSASESNVPEHQASHSVFGFAPPSFLRVTLQHGFECVGFRHSAAHDRVYGKSVSFAADIVCAWQPPDKLPSLSRSQMPKVLVTGPTGVLQRFSGPISIQNPPAPGLICENLHSVRLKSAPGLTDLFLATFKEFTGLLAEDGRGVVLRPHPGGQFVLKNGIELPPNVEVNNAPIYRLDLRRFAYGISAPSSVLIDMLLADVPVAVWRDPAGDVDVSNYAGLTVVSDAVEMRKFANAATKDPKPFVERQRRFLIEQGMPTDPAEVFAGFAKIFQAAERLQPVLGTAAVPKQRYLLIANAHLPTVQVCLERPLRALVRNGELAMDLLTEQQLKEQQARLGSAEGTASWIEQKLEHFGPDALIFSRYSGPFSSDMIDWARRRGVPVIYHIDDDLLGVPRSLGDAKHAYHNAPERIATVRSLLETADLIYASTEVLRDRLLARMPDIPVVAGKINASGRVMSKPRDLPAAVMGYMASADHAPNLEMVLPAIVKVLDRHPQLSFELFGSITVPSELERFASRIRRFDPVADYEEFLEALRNRHWDVGICPLTPTAFNRTKSNNKWVEYTSVGAAVVASAGMIYDECCADCCGILATDLEEWTAALDLLASNTAERLSVVGRAQQKLASDFSISEHRQQIMDIVQMARERSAQRLVREFA